MRNSMKSTILKTFLIGELVSSIIMTPHIAVRENSDSNTYNAYEQKLISTTTQPFKDIQKNHYYQLLHIDSNPSVYDT